MPKSHETTEADDASTPVVQPSEPRTRRMYAKMRVPTPVTELVSRTARVAQVSMVPREGFKPVVIRNAFPKPLDGKRTVCRWTEDDGNVYREFSSIDADDNRMWLTVKDYEDAVQAHLDAKAREKGYDSIYTCIGYWNSTVPSFAAEARLASEWRDQVWTKCHEVLNAWGAGEIEQPTIAQLIAMLPTLQWA